VVEDDDDDDDDDGSSLGSSLSSSAIVAAVDAMAVVLYTHSERETHTRAWEMCSGKEASLRKVVMEERKERKEREE
jgi:hypothetical protein